MLILFWAPCSLLVGALALKICTVLNFYRLFGHVSYFFGTVLSVLGMLLVETIWLRSK
jgi:hypothetical protein